jgi:hypothetical protein
MSSASETIHDSVKAMYVSMVAWDKTYKIDSSPGQMI